MMLIVIIFLIAGLTIAIIEVATRLNPGISLGWLPLWASVPIPGLLLLYWLYNLWWMHSDHCQQDQVCGREGIAYLTVGTGVGFFGSFFVSMTIAILWINWRKKK